jgi:uncharacterized protein YbaR (Trm112 family)
MPLEPRLLEILCCPADHEGRPCHGDLSELEGGLLCARCGRLYPVEDGIPVMLVDKATRPAR